MLSLPGESVVSDDLHACHRMRKTETRSIVFLLNRKTLQNKSLDLAQLDISGKLFITETMCYENH